MIVLPMQSHHCYQIAKLHMENLNSNFQGNSGLHLLKVYYHAIIVSNGACGFIAQRDNRVIGFICGVWDSRNVQDTMFKYHFLEIIKWAFVHVIIHPQCMIDLIRRVGGRKEIFYTENGYELRPIVISPRERGSGVGTTLVRNLIGDAAQRGYKSIYLYTEKGNLLANSLYHKIGFDRKKEFHSQGRDYIYYEYQISNIQ